MYVVVPAQVANKDLFKAGPIFTLTPMGAVALGGGEYLLPNL